MGNDFELIPVIKMENRHFVGGSFGSEFPAIYNHCRVMAAGSHDTFKILHFLEKLPIMVKLSKFCSESFYRDTDQHVLFKLREIWPTGNQ